MIEAEGLSVFPGFVDPHVHLRTPGREDEEDLESGTRAAAAGGFCCVLAMPNTEPVVDNASVLRSLHERAGLEASVPVGFLASVTKGLAGTALTEMAELAEEGAAGFTDDGVPIVEASLVRQALQYQRMCGGVLVASRGGSLAVRRRGDARRSNFDAARIDGDTAVVGEHDGGARCRDRPLRGRTVSHAAPVGGRVRGGGRAREGRRRRRSRQRSRHTISP